MDDSSVPPVFPYTLKYLHRKPLNLLRIPRYLQLETYKKQMALTQLRLLEVSAASNYLVEIAISQIPSVQKVWYFLEKYPKTELIEIEVVPLHYRYYYPLPHTESAKRCFAIREKDTLKDWANWCLRIITRGPNHEGMEFAEAYSKPPYTLSSKQPLERSWEFGKFYGPPGLNLNVLEDNITQKIILKVVAL